MNSLVTSLREPLPIIDPQTHTNLCIYDSLASRVSLSLSLSQQLVLEYVFLVFFVCNKHQRLWLNHIQTHRHTQTHVYIYIYDSRVMPGLSISVPPHFIIGHMNSQVTSLSEPRHLTGNAQVQLVTTSYKHSHRHTATHTNKHMYMYLEPAM